jgi:PKD repeat protein
MFFSLVLRAQENEFLHCGSSEKYKELSEKHPEILVQDKQMRVWIANYIQAHPQAVQQTGRQTRSGVPLYIIPIVFHIIHNYGPENISDAQVLDEVRILNEDYSNTNADTSAVIPAFKPIVADCQVQFKLAQLDFDGNCTNGIERIVSFEATVGNDESKLHQWNRSEYLNVWVVKQMAQGLAGYAYFPSATSGGMFPVDGVIILSAYIGSIGTSSPMTSRALTHEIGHYFSLEHPWGNTNSPGVACGDDGVNDTPVTKGWTTCVLNGCVCDTGHHVIENVQNYMEYSYCSKMFTQGQKQLMTATLNNSMSGRNNLWAPATLANTGVLNTPVLCKPHVDFHASAYFICAGGSITFTDNSWGATVSKRNWYFQNGSPSTSSAPSPSITFNVPGWHQVILASSNAAGTDSIIRNQYVFVSAPYPDYFGLKNEDFENVQETQNHWTVVNHFNFEGTWSQVNSCGHSGTSCMKMDNYINAMGASDDLVSPAFDLSLVSGGSLSYWHSEASRIADTSQIKDVLKVYSSVNCGQSWALLQTLKGPALYSAGMWGTPYVASSSNLWSQSLISLPASLMVSNVRFKFEFTSGGTNVSNNLYLDDINVTVVMGVEENRVSGFNLSLQPNPAKDETLITYSLAREENISITVSDLCGKDVVVLKNETQSSGTHEININRQAMGLSPGMYFVRFTNGISRATAKLIFAD